MTGCSFHRAAADAQCAVCDEIAKAFAPAVGSAETVIKAARELYSAHMIVMHTDATEDDHYRARFAARKLQEALKAYDQK